MLVTAKLPAQSWSLQPPAHAKGLETMVAQGNVEWSLWSRAGPEMGAVELGKRDRVIGL